MIKGKTWLSATILLAIPALLSIIFYAYLGSYSRLIADDYCSIYLANRLSLLRLVWFWYKTWSGCYSTSVIDAVLAVSPLLVKWGSALTISAWLIVTTWLFFLLMPGHYRKHERFWIAFIFGCLTLFITLTLIPSPSQSLFWWGGLRSYLLPLVVFILGLALFFQINQSGTADHLPWYFLLGLGLSFFGAGFSETLTPILVVFWTILLGIKVWVTRHQVRDAALAYSAAYLMGTLLGLVAMILAPGNTTRQALFQERPNLFEILAIASTGFLNFLNHIFKAPVNLLGIAALFGIAVWIGSFKPYQNHLPKWYSLAAFLAGFVLAFGCFPPAAFGMAEPAPNRTLILAVFFLVSGFTISFYLLGSGITIKKSDHAGLLAGWFFLILAALTGTAWLNFRQLTSYQQILANYAIYWDSTDQQIRTAAANGQKQIIIHGERNWTGLNDPGDNPKFWVNSCMSNYYGLNILADNTGMQPGDIIP